MPKILRSFATMYLPKTPWVWVYMLQQVEYDARLFFQWISRSPDYRSVIKRKKLVRTSKAMALLLLAYGLWLAGVLCCIYLITTGSYIYVLIALLITPIVVLGGLGIVSTVGTALLTVTRKNIFRKAKHKIDQQKAVKIAVLGSYGKTTVKELLSTVLAESKRVAATPGNNNVAISHARWALRNLTGEEEVIIVEFGEFKPGDITAMAQMWSPDMAIITGVAPNHLENYRDYDELKKDLASIQLFVRPDKLFVSVGTAKKLGLAEDSYQHIQLTEVLDWTLSDIATAVDGTSFVMKKEGKSLQLRSGLLGAHLVEPLALVAALANRLGATKDEIERGIAKTVPYEHRMQPIHVSGAVVIDDTYNGSIEGMRAGLKLLSSLEAKRKIYVTPGLVEQGQQTEAMHDELGKLIAEAKPDKVVLMQNSVRSFIEKSLRANDYNGELVVEEDPLYFYTHMQYGLAAGDLVLMQNDWTDNYN